MIHSCGDLPDRASFRLPFHAGQPGTGIKTSGPYRTRYALRVTRQKTVTRKKKNEYVIMRKSNYVYA